MSKTTNCAWCNKEFIPRQLKERNYHSRQCLGFANAVRNGTYIKQVKEEADEVTWDEDIAYLIGIIATDGTLRPDRPQIKITSKSERFLSTLLHDVITDFTGRDQHVNKVQAPFQGRKYPHYQLQFTSTPFYNFCLDIGLTPNKTYTLDSLTIPDKYFGDFLRGVVDGDGNYNLDKRRGTCRIRIYSGSREFLEWIDSKCVALFGVGGAKFHKSINKLGGKYILVYHSFYDVVKILDQMYSNDKVCYEEKKTEIIGIIDELENLKQRYAVGTRKSRTVTCANRFCSKTFEAKTNDHFYCSVNCGDKQRKYPNKQLLTLQCAHKGCKEKFVQTTANNKYCQKHLAYRK